MLLVSTLQQERNGLQVNGLFQKVFVTPLLRITIFRSHTPLEFYLIFHHHPTSPPPPPLEFHGNPLSSIMTTLEFSNFKRNPLEFSRFSFLRPPGISVILNRGIRKISGKVQSKGNAHNLAVLRIDQEQHQYSVASY